MRWWISECTTGALGQLCSSQLEIREVLFHGHHSLPLLSAGPHSGPISSTSTRMPPAPLPWFIQAEVVYLSEFSQHFLHPSLTQLNTFYLVLLSCNTLYFVLAVLYAAQLTPVRHYCVGGLRWGRRLLALFAYSGLWNLDLDNQSLSHLDICLILSLLRLFICSHFNISKIGMSLITYVKRNLPPAGSRVSWDRVVCPWENLARHIYNKQSKYLLLKAWLHFHVF